MTKNRWSWRETIKSFENHIDPEKQEELRGTKIEIDENATKIVRLLRNKNKQDKKDGNSRKDAQIVEFIQDFQKQYQALYALYDNLREQVTEKVHGKEEKGSSSSFSSSSSNSDSESYYTPNAKGGRTSPSKSELQKVKGNLKQKLETSHLKVADLRNKLTSVTEEKEAINSEYMVSLSKIQELEKIIEGLRIEAYRTESITQKLMDESSQLKDKLTEKEKELLSLIKIHRANESEASTQIMEFGNQATSMKLELETLWNQKQELKGEIERQATKARQVGDENLLLKTRILELEVASKEKEDEISTTVKKFEENENILRSKIEDLMAQVGNMQLEVDTLQTQKDELEKSMVCKSNEASAQVRSIMNNLDVLQQDLESLSSQKTELECQLKKQAQEISAFLIQIENLTEEKEGLRVKVKDLELEENSLSSQKNELEEQITSKDQETDQLRVEKEGLHAKILEMEQLQVERSDELSSIQTKLKDLENDTTSKSKALRAQIKSLQQELDSLKTEKSQLELQIEREKQESSKSLTQLEKQNIKLTNKIADQDEIINRLNKENKQVKDMFLESKLNLQLVERKTEEMAEELRKKFEDGLRLLSRRIRVAEQLHVENKDFYSKTKEKYEQEHEDLKERITTHEVTVRRIKDTSLTANEMLTGLDSVALKFEECSGNFLNRISKVSCELKFAKDWVSRKNNAIKHVQEDVDCLLAQLDVKEAEILGFREKLWKLETKVRELEKTVKEKEEEMLGLGEEKREAIRQLCVWIDYHRSRCDYLKKMLSEMTVRS